MTVVSAPKSKIGSQTHGHSYTSETSSKIPSSFNHSSGHAMTSPTTLKDDDLQLLGYKISSNSVDYNSLLFEYVDRPNSHLCCPICLQPLRNPFVTPCRHMFCAECIRAWSASQDMSLSLSSSLSNPDSQLRSSTFETAESILLLKRTQNSKFPCPIDRAIVSFISLKPAVLAVDNMLKEMKVCCLNKSIGCDYISQEQHMRSHLEWDCVYSLINCPNNECRSKFQRRRLRFHMLEECQYRLTECIKCHSSFPLTCLKTHEEKDCPFRQVICPFCFQLFEREEFLNNHSLDMGCPKRPISCKVQHLGCSWKGFVESYENHLKECYYFGLQDYIILSNNWKIDIEKSVQSSKESYDKWMEKMEQRLNGSQDRYQSLQQQLLEANNQIGCLESQLRLLICERRYFLTELNILKKRMNDCLNMIYRPPPYFSSSTLYMPMIKSNSSSEMNQEDLSNYKSLEELVKKVSLSKSSISIENSEDIHSHNELLRSAYLEEGIRKESETVQNNCKENRTINPMQPRNEYKEALTNESSCTSSKLPIMDFMTNAKSYVLKRGETTNQSSLQSEINDERSQMRSFSTNKFLSAVIKKLSDFV